MRSSFGIQEGAALVAVERANGGELAPLLQVLWTLHGFTPPGSRPDPARFAASATLLIGLGVVEYVDNQLGLTPEGRKLLRRSGMPNDARHVALVTELLQEFDDVDLEDDGPVIAPTEADVQQALSDGNSIQQTEGGAGARSTRQSSVFIPTVSSSGRTGSRRSRPRTPAKTRNGPRPRRCRGRQRILSSTACSAAGDEIATGPAATRAAEPAARAAAAQFAARPAACRRPPA